MGTVDASSRAGVSGSGRVFAIGDIHGCIDNLRILMERLPYTKGKDTLVFIGDYIDRGPSVREVIDFVCDLQDSGHNVVPLMGNHEYYLLEGAKAGDETFLTLLREIGVDATLESYNAADLSAILGLAFMSPRHRKFLEDLIPLWETDDFIFVHGGLAPWMPVKDQCAPTIYEVRDLFFSSEIDFGKRVIFGHTPFEMPLVTPTKIGIDTGAVYGNMLTAIELPGLHFYHA